MRNALKTLSDADSRKVGGCGNIYDGGSRFLFERDLHRREARLLAQACPTASELVAEEFLTKKNATFLETDAASAMLRCLAGRGNRRAELLLLRTADSTRVQPNTRDTALYALVAFDLEGLYKEFYRSGWKPGSVWATDLLDVAMDEASLALLAKVSSDPAVSDFIREDADRALQRLRTLQRPDASARLIDLIGAPPAWEDRDVERKSDPERRWALRAACARGLDLRAALRMRLDRDLESAKKRCQELCRLYPLSSPFEVEFTKSVFLFPGDWDDCLVAFVEMGGVPNELERKRLHEFGYLCDPKERLSELLEDLR